MKQKYRGKKMNKELSEKVKILSDKYCEELKEKGIRCNFSEREFKTPVSNFFDKDSLTDNFLHKLSEKREKKLYKNKANRYDTLVLDFSPLDKNAKVTSPKSYAFMLKSFSRVGKGFKPEEKIYDMEKVMEKAEKCIQKILFKAEKFSPEKVCESSFSDNLRYSCHEKYNYKKTIFGKDRDMLTVSVILIFSLIMIIAVSIIYLT